MEHELFDQPIDLLSASAKPYIHTLSTINKSKLDKSQARRLKMPKRNRSAYFLFSMDTRAKLKAELGNLTPLEMQAKVSQYWRDLSPEEKEKYEVRAKEEKVEYLAAMEKFYSSLTPETLAKSKSNRPKKPCSAYAHFVRDIKTDLKKDNPRLIMQEILHIASDKWKNLEDSVRVVYEEKAKHDKELYMSEVRKMSLADQESPKNKTQASSDDERLGKRSMRTSDTSEKAPKKQIKLELLSTNSESQDDLDEIIYRPVKPEIKQALKIADLPYLGKTLFEVPQENSQLPFSLTQIPALEPIVQTEKVETVYIPPLNPNIEKKVPALLPALGGEVDRLKEVMLAKLSWDRLVQTNNSLEHAIARRVAEVRALQTQQLLFARGAFLAANSTNIF